MKSRRKTGRPTRAQASAKALANVDLSSVDPRLVLLQIAADATAPATARVQACRALLAQAATKEPTGTDADPVTELALKLLRRK